MVTKNRLIVACLVMVSGLSAMHERPDRTLRRPRRLPVPWISYEVDRLLKHELELHRYRELSEIMHAQLDLINQCKYWQEKLSQVLKRVPPVPEVDWDNPESVAELEKTLEIFRKCDEGIEQINKIKDGLLAQVAAGKENIEAVIQECGALQEDLGTMPW